MPVTMLRPNLISASGNLLEDEGALWRNPGTPGDVDVMNIRVTLPQAVHGVQAAAAIADFSIATGWQEQEQELDARIELGPGQMYPASGFLDFPFTITHGGGTMSPRAFRARTYLDVEENEVTVRYYSRWKYWFAGRQAIQLTNAPVSLDTVNHIETRDVSSTDGLVFAQFINPDGSIFSDFVGSSATLVMKQVFNIGEPVVGWMTPYRLLVRNKDPFSFSDDERSYVFDLISRVATDAENIPGYLPIEAPDLLQDPGAFPIGDSEFPELEPGAPCSVVATIYADDNTTPQWSVGTDPTHPAPYLIEPSGYAEQQIDAATGAATIGTLSVSVVDVPRIPGDQDSGWLTRRLASLGLGDITGRRCRVVRYISVEEGFVVLVDGRAGEPVLDPEFSSYTFEVDDTRDGEADLRLFDLIGSGVPATPSSAIVPQTPVAGVPPTSGVPVPGPTDDGKVLVANPDGTYSLVTPSGGYPDGPLPDPYEMEVLVDTNDVGGVADGAAMTTWPNQGYAGSAKDFTNAGGGVRPIYRQFDSEDGLPYVETDGVDDYFRVLGMPVYTGGELTIFLVSRAGLWTNNARIFSLADPGNVDGGTSGSVIYQELAGNGGVLRRGGVSHSANNAVGSGTGFYDAQFTWQCLAVRYGLVDLPGGATRAVLTMMQGSRVVSFDLGASSLTGFNFESLFLGAGNASGDGSTPDNFWPGGIRHFSYGPFAMPILEMRDSMRRLCQDHGVPVMD